MKGSTAHYSMHLVKINYSNKCRYLRYHIHKLLWRIFPDKLISNDPCPFLYRILGRDKEGFVECLVQSAVKPSWMNLDREKLKVIQTKHVDTTIELNSKYYFRLEASPVQNEFLDKNIRGKKRIVTRNDEAEKWLNKKAFLAGFDVHELIMTNKVIKIRKNLSIGTPDILLSSCIFDGHLSVNNPLKFSNALINGIGPKKSFGFGMLTISR